MNSLAALIIASSILVLIPGLNVALIVANSIKYGFRMGVVTVLGTTVGAGLQLLLVVFGLATAIAVAADALMWIKWAGVVYLVYLGIRTWREPAGDLGAVKPAPAMFWRGCMVALLNPKMLVFNAAFIPQFVGSDNATIVQVGLVAAVYLAVLLLGDILWAASATTARGLIGRYGRLRNRVTGAFLTMAGIGLAMTHK